MSVKQRIITKIFAYFLRYRKQRKKGARITFTSDNLTHKKQIINLKVIMKNIIDTVFIKVAKNSGKRHWSITID